MRTHQRPSTYNQGVAVGSVVDSGELFHDSRHGTPTLRPRIATEERVADLAGNYTRCTQAHWIVFFGRLAVKASQQIRNGQRIRVSGLWERRTILDRDTGDHILVRELRAENFSILNRGSQ